MLDEPELHLNADLIRAWVLFLTSTVTSGQIWLATHSLEAVEATGQHSTFILERNEETRKVDRATRLDTRPVLSALSRAVGTPAFSISQLRFVFVEGEEGIGERERYRNLGGMLPDVRFIECGSCNEVLRRVSAIKALAKEADAGIRIGGIMDRDFRSDTEANELNKAQGVYVLPLHEGENFFLHPATLTILLQQNGRGHLMAANLIQDAADVRAGSWIFQHAMATANAKSLSEISLAAKERAKSLTWSQFNADRDASIDAVVAISGLEAENQHKLKCILEISRNVYARVRAEEDFWKVCEGKQVLSDVARAVGFNNPATLVQATFVIWARDSASIPNEVAAFRQYLAGL